MNVAKKKCKRSLAYLMALIMLISIFPISAFAEGETAEVGITEKVEAAETTENTNKSKSNLDLVAEQLWDGIKDKNSNKDAVTENLSIYEFAAVDPNGVVSFKSNKWMPGVNVKIEWKPIQDKYADCLKTMYGCFQISRPAEDKEVSLEAVLSNSEDNGETKNVSIRFTIKGEMTKDILKVLVNEGKNKKESNFTKDSWDTFATALANAEKIANSFLSTPTESEIKDAYETLKTAMDQLVSTGKVFNPLDYITPDELFKVLQGENLDKDNIIKNLTKTPYEFAVVSDTGVVEWRDNAGWGNDKASVRIKEWVSSHPDYINVKGKYGEYSAFAIRKYPTEDLKITFTAKIISIGEYASENLSKEVSTTVTLKTKPIEEFNPISKITEEKLFSLIQGNNRDKNNITMDLSNKYGLKFYATVLDNDETENIVWHQKKNQEDNLEITWKKSSAPTYVDIESTEMPNRYTAFTIKQLPDDDTKITFTASLKNLKNNQTQDLDVSIILKAKYTKEEKIKAQLNGYLEKHLKAENMEYAINEQEGISFLEDYKKDKVLYDFRLPVIKALENLPYREVDTKITTDDPNTVIDGYVIKPARNDVGGETKTIKITYSMTKEGITVSRDFIVRVAPLTKEEIDHEVKILNKIKEELDNGFTGKNFDKNNICHNLTSFQEVHWDAQDNLVWVMSANSPLKKAFGFRFPRRTDFTSSEPKYIDGKLNLIERPEQDVKVNISIPIESFILGRYPAMYPNNKELQKLGNQKISLDLVIKKIDATANKFTIDGNEIPVKEGIKDYSILTENTLDKVRFAVGLNNKSADLVIDGQDFTNIHKTDITLKNGYKKIAVIVSDRDGKKESIGISNSYNVSIVSKKYLNDRIASLPEDLSVASDKDKKLAEDLIIQFDSLTDADKQKIVGKEKLEKYREVANNTNTTYEKQVNEVCKELFNGIKGENYSKDMVFTDLLDINYASFTKDGIVWTKEAVNSDVKITWTSSDSPKFVNVFGGYDFESNYTEAFKIANRLPFGQSDKEVTFYATVSHLKATDLKKDTSVKFSLKPYDARLENLIISELPQFKFDKNKYDYEIMYKNLDKITIKPTSIYPNVIIKVDGKKIASNDSIVLPLDAETKTITINVADVELNNRNPYDKKEYRITFTQKELGEVDKEELRLKLDEAKKIDLSKYIVESAKDLKAAIQIGSEVLAKTDSLQSEVNAATKALVDSMKKLVELPNADKTDINKEIESALWLSESCYQQGSWHVFEVALQKAIKDSNTPYIQQSEIDATKNVLIEAKNNLRIQNRENIELTESENVKLAEGSRNNVFYNITLNNSEIVKNISVDFASNSNSILAIQGNVKNLPEIVVNRDNKVLNIPAEAIVNRNVDIELLSPLNKIANQVFQKKIERWVNDLDKKVNVFESNKFSSNGIGKLEKYATVTFKGMAGKSVMAINSDGSMTAVTKGKNISKDIYAGEINKDLVVYTKTMDIGFVIYAVNSTNIGDDKPVEPTGKFVTISVDLKTIKKGYLVDKCKIEINKGDTVWDVLKKAARQNNLYVEYTKSKEYDNGIYVSAINDIGEFDYGQHSGWMYNVNGKYPDYACDKYDLSGNERIQWRYTTNLGEDLGESATAATGRSSVKTEIKETKVTGKAEVEAVTDKNGKAIAEVTIENIKEAIEAVAKTENKSLKEVKIVIKSVDKVKEVETKFSKKTMSELIKNVDVVKVQTPIADITLNKDNLEQLTKNQNGDIKLTIKKVENLASDYNSDVQKNINQLIDQRPAFEFNISAGNKVISNFNQKVAVTIPYETRKKENTNAIVIFCVNDSGDLELVKDCIYNDKEKSITFNTVQSTKYAVGYKDVSFNDVDKHWAKDEIVYLAARNVVKGIDDNAFAPNNKITRAEFVQILANLSDADLSGYAKSNFNDVNKEAWFAKSAAWAEKNGLASGIIQKDGTTSFNPNAYITREDMAVILSRYMSKIQKKKLNQINKETKFSDKEQIGNYAEDAVTELQKAGIINGKTTDKFAPKENAVRAECAKMISSLIKNNLYN